MRQEAGSESGRWARLIASYIFLSLYPCSVSSLRDWADPRVHVPFFRRLCIVVRDLHRCGVSHEDLKRSNILVSHTRQPVLADFGFAHFKPDGGMVTSLGGTTEYSAPEKLAVSEC